MLGLTASTFVLVVMLGLTASTFVLMAMLGLTTSTFVLVAMFGLTASTFALVAMLGLTALYQGDQFSWWKKPEYSERTTNHGQATGKLYYVRLRAECTFFVLLTLN
jgi:hypothetical protein